LRTDAVAELAGIVKVPCGRAKSTGE